MLTEQQQEWLDHLSETDIVKITPYNPKVKEVFMAQKAEILSALGNNVTVLHKGASAWGISGKGDVDIYVPVPQQRFDLSVGKLTECLGKPNSYYPLERVRWNRQTDDIDVEIFVMNENSKAWEDSVVFWNYIETHTEVLDEYRRIKENAEGVSVKEYYTRKVIFINGVIELVDK